MKSMTCKQWGGACEKRFSADTFDEMVLIIQSHLREMSQWKDLGHMKTGYEMSKIVKNKEELDIWINAKKIEFDLLEED
jgi:hypothetical protein